MLRIYGCITDQHDLRLVVLAGLICFLACYTASNLTARAREVQCRGQSAQARADDHDPIRRPRHRAHRADATRDPSCPQRCLLNASSRPLQAPGRS